MSEAVVMTEQIEETRTNVVDVAQKTLRAGVGAAAMVQEEALSRYKKFQEQINEFVEKTQADATGLVEKMIERGADVEENGRVRVNELIESRKKQVDETAKEAQGSLEGRIETILHSMNVPTKSDIDGLNKKIATLTRKVNALAKKQEAAKAS